VIFWTYSLYIGNRLPYRESAGNALTMFPCHLLPPYAALREIRIVSGSSGTINGFIAYFMCLYLF
jgi:hypothetical protein